METHCVQRFSCLGIVNGDLRLSKLVPFYVPSYPFWLPCATPARCGSPVGSALYLSAPCGFLTGLMVSQVALDACALATETCWWWLLSWHASKVLLTHSTPWAIMGPYKPGARGQIFTKTRSYSRCPLLTPLFVAQCFNDTVKLHVSFWFIWLSRLVRKLR